MPINLVEGRKAGSGLPLDLQSLRAAYFEQLQNAGFDQLIDRKLARELAVVDNQHLVAWSGTGIASSIEFLLGFFPSEGHPAYTTLDTFSDGALFALRTAIVTVTQAISQLETETLSQNEKPSDVVICQHIGPEEGDYAGHALQSFTQYHLHVFSNMTRGNELTSYSKSLRNGLREPFSPVMADIIAHSGVNIQFESSTGSLLIADNSPLLSINHFRTLAKCMTLWRKTWDELASYFTNFETDDLNRFKPNINSLDLNNFFHKHQLSSRSFRLLSFLKNHLQHASEEAAPWSWLSKGIYGSVSIVYHAKEDTWSIRLIPRSRVTDYSTLVISKDLTQVIDKDRSKRYNPDEEAIFLNNQMAAMDLLKKLFNRISPLVILLAIMSGPEPIVEKYAGRVQNE